MSLSSHTHSKAAGLVEPFSHLIPYSGSLLTKNGPSNCKSWFLLSYNILLHYITFGLIAALTEFCSRVRLAYNFNLSFYLNFSFCFQFSPAGVWLHVQMNIHVIPQLAVIHKTLATVVTFERLVVVCCVDAPDVLLHV